MLAANDIQVAAGARPDGPATPAISPRPSRRNQVIVTTIALLIPLGMIMFLIIFQPFTDAAGGCGGG